jgi:hypothetical protein
VSFAKRNPARVCGNTGGISGPSCTGSAAISWRALLASSDKPSVSEKVRSPSRALMALIGNKGANAISEKEPNYERATARSSIIERNARFISIRGATHSPQRSLPCVGYLVQHVLHARGLR